MRKFQGFVVKEFYHIFRDRRTLLILFGMPVVQLVLFGFAIRNEVKDIRIAIVDHSNDYVTQQIIYKLLASGYFVAHEYLASEEEIDRAFERGVVKEAIIFEPEFARRLNRDGKANIHVVTDATDPNTSSTMQAYTSAIVLDFQQSLSIPQGIQIIPETRMRFNPELKSVNLFVPGLIAVILMLVCALMTSITITREKEMGTMEVLLVSPLNPFQIIIGKVLPYLFLSFVSVVSVLLLAWFIFKVPIQGSLLLLLLESILFIVCALSLGIMISTVSASQQTATMASLAGLLLPTIILSGFIFPISSMPAPLQWISHIVPARWFLVIIKGIMLKGVGLAYLWKETTILAGMTLLLMIVSIKNFKIRLE